MFPQRDLVFNHCRLVGLEMQALTSSYSYGFAQVQGFIKYFISKTIAQGGPTFQLADSFYISKNRGVTHFRA
jgi:hypothetical protein